jgi:hypothetical protein
MLKAGLIFSLSKERRVMNYLLELGAGVIARWT